MTHLRKTLLCIVVRDVTSLGKPLLLRLSSGTVKGPIANNQFIAENSLFTTINMFDGHAISYFHLAEAW